ncbi:MULTISPECIES: DNA methyltransferase [unclassified Blastomonas]|uniref:DNA methyltransferase n=1 Tax=unclassified Blastomonas TaxID=2626550 RepID=UPI0008244EA5|nr:MULTISPECIES: DNA methyltransferase [unclassified Blastomonas]
MSITVHHGQMQDWLAAYDGPLFDSCATDPPYHLTSIVKRFGKDGSAPCKAGSTGAYARASKGFMGKEWDGGDVAFRPETWRAVFDKLKPGAHLVAFSGTRTFHRMVCAIEDAGFEIRDTICWHYGSGFPKSHSMRSIERPELGTALKPATELICLARKPLSEKSVAANVLRWGTGAINIDGCRIGTDEELRAGASKLWSHYREGEPSADKRYQDQGSTNFAMKPGPRGGAPEGRWPANLIHDGSDEAIEGFPSEAGAFAPVRKRGADKFRNTYGSFGGNVDEKGSTFKGDSGSAARFFYSAKAGPLDRLGSTHATIKPVDLMRWLCRLVTPPGGHILEPFAGSGTTGIAAMAEQMSCTMIEMEADHVADIERKLAILRGESAGLIEQHLNARRTEPVETLGGLFA